MQTHDALKQALLAENKQVPRYTSYPTAPHFTEKTTDSIVSAWMENIQADNQLSLYFHIPYCRTLCWYCGCHTRATKRYGIVSGFLDTLMQEIELVASKLKRKLPVRHIHFGGGSPSMIGSEDFARLMAEIRTHFNVMDGAEIAIELDPREVTEAKVAAYALAGINRASLGVQDFHVDVQTAINRRQPFHVVYNTVKLLRSYGINRINMDFLYGLPHQTVGHMIENLDLAKTLEPDRISLFGYAHVPWMKKHMRLIDESALPDAEQRLAQFEAATNTLGEMGYKAIGLDHFVRSDDPMAASESVGTLRRNFQGYTTDVADALIGFGPSAISAYPQGYCQNTSVSKDYNQAIERGEMATMRGLTLSDDDKLRAAVIEELMCYFQIDLVKFCKKHGIRASYFEGALASVERLQERGLVEFKNGAITIPDGARQAVRLVCAAFDVYLQDKQNRHAQVA